MPRHPIFEIYTRAYLHRVTGLSKQHLSRVATGKQQPTRSFIDRCCLALNRPAKELFLLDAASVPSSGDPNHN